MNYQIGSTIQYMASNGDLRTVKVTEKYDEIPQWDKPGFDGTDVNDAKNLFWGFDDTILSVVEY